MHLHLHTWRLFRVFMYYGFLPLFGGALTALIYLLLTAFPLITFATTEDKDLFVYISVYASIILCVIAVAAWSVIDRHYRRLDEVRMFIEAAGGQTFVDSFIANEMAALVHATTAQETDTIKAAFKRLTGWAHRFGYSVRSNPYEYLPTFEGA